MDKKIKIVGCGPGSPDYVTPAASKAVASANVIIGAQKLLDLFPDSKAVREPLNRNLSLAIDSIATYMDKNVVAVLVSGDPGVFSLAKLVIKRYGENSCEVIPGVSSVQVAFARLGLDWHDTLLVSAHKEVPDVDLTKLYEQFGKLAIFAAAKPAVTWIVSSFRDAPLPPQAVVCQNLTLADEKIDLLSLKELESFEIGSSSIIILLDGEKF